MARTQIPVETFTSGADLNSAGTAVDQANGMYITADDDGIPGLRGSVGLLLYVQNSAAGTKTVTVRAGPDNVTAPRSGEGDLTTGNMTASTGQAFIGPIESARFMQSDGNIYVDFSSGTTGTIWAIVMPRQPEV